MRRTAHVLSGFTAGFLAVFGTYTLILRNTLRRHGL